MLRRDSLPLYPTYSWLRRSYLRAEDCFCSILNPFFKNLPSKVISKYRNKFFRGLSSAFPKGLQMSGSALLFCQYHKLKRQSCIVLTHPKSQSHTTDTKLTCCLPHITEVTAKLPAHGSILSCPSPAPRWPSHHQHKQRWTESGRYYHMDPWKRHTRLFIEGWAGEKQFRADRGKNRLV